jgi:hypothetical protein
MESIEALTDDLDSDKVLLTIEEDDWNAVCHPQIEGATHVSQKHGAPFAFRTSGDPPSPTEVGDLFSEQFDSKVSAVYDLIDESDDPLETILDLEPDKL